MTTLHIEPQPHRQSRMDVLTPIILLVGGPLIPVLGWAAGVVLLWTSRAWTRREKVVGTLVIPGGLMVPVLLLTAGRSAPSEGCAPSTTTPDGTTVFTICSSPSLLFRDPQFTLLVIVAFVAPVLTTVYLVRAARRHRATPVAAAG